MEDIYKHIYSTCQNPLKVKVYNGIKNCYEYKDVPCGKCYHCKITKINEWVTRMVIQANYSNYVYFGTLTYNGKRESIYNDECLAKMSTFNDKNSLNNTPIILRKDHLQKFFKRLRKNTKSKISYCACGEYGSTYGRPHYHYILYSNQPISKMDIYKAWTAPAKKDPSKKVVIGKVDHQDIKHQFNPDDPDNACAYKYVCKYIQKYDFNFEELSNIKMHYETFKKHFQYVTHIDQTKEYLNLFGKLDNYLKEKDVYTFEEYKKVFSPFFVSSRNPAIAYQYLKDNIGEFQKQNFKLFGISENYLFPLYFIRKTKESLCPIKAKSETNDGFNSYSRLPKVETLLNNIIRAQEIAEESEQIVQLFRNHYNYYTLESREQLQDLESRIDDKSANRPYIYRISKDYLSFHDSANHCNYIFMHDHYAVINTTTFEYIAEISLEEGLNIIKYNYEKIKPFLVKLYSKSKISADKKNTLIAFYGGIDKFNETKTRCLESFNNHIKHRQKKYKLTKTFE